MSKNDVNEEKNNSFFQKMKNDKKYNAKVQLIGYGIFLLILVVYLNFSGDGSGSLSGNTVLGNTIVGGIQDGDKDLESDNNLLETLDDNYSYDIVVNISKKSMNTETEEEIETKESIQYKGKSSENKLEIEKKVGDVSNLYYKVDNNYYSMVDNVTSNVKEVLVYDVIDGEYIELSDILKLISIASLDHVTEFSSGKRESVYHLKVRDVITGYQNNDDVVEINVIEENGILSINIDYSKLYNAIDENIIGCKMEAIITDIGKVEDFEVVVKADDNNNLDESVDGEGKEDENTSLE